MLCAGGKPGQYVDCRWWKTREELRKAIAASDLVEASVTAADAAIALGLLSAKHRGKVHKAGA